MWHFFFLLVILSYIKRGWETQYLQVRLQDILTLDVLVPVVHWTWKNRNKLQKTQNYEAAYSDSTFKKPVFTYLLLHVFFLICECV